MAVPLERHFSAQIDLVFQQILDVHLLLYRPALVHYMHQSVVNYLLLCIDSSRGPHLLVPFIAVYLYWLFGTLLLVSEPFGRQFGFQLVFAVQ